MRTRFTDRVALVTGATEGAGFATARLFGLEGAAVVISGRSAEKGERALDALRAEGIEAVFLAGDAADPHSVESLVRRADKHYGRLDHLVANVGLMAIGTAEDTELDVWRQVIDLNLTSAFLLAKYGLPVVARGGGGTMVLTAGELGLVGARATVAYCAAKGGVINLSKALAVDAAEHGIRVNCVCPGPIDTPLLHEWYASAEDPAALKASQEDPVLLKRVASADEVARATLFLSSDDSSYTTGSNLMVDGGLTASYGLTPA